jgi:hypothetical protein
VGNAFAAGLTDRIEERFIPEGSYLSLVAAKCQFDGSDTGYLIAGPGTLGTENAFIAVEIEERIALINGKLPGGLT